MSIITIATFVIGGVGLVVFLLYVRNRVARQMQGGVAQSSSDGGMFIYGDSGSSDSGSGDCDSGSDGGGCDGGGDGGGGD